MRQWNQNYRIGGTGCLIRTLEGNTGLFVDHYAVVDFRGFKQMVDALGGVDVCTSEPIDDANTHLQLDAGRHTLDGRQALQYVRVRKSVGDGSDLGRIERQQAFLSSVMQQATSTQLLVQPNRLFSFLDAATKSLTTDPEFGLGTMRDMATSVKGIGLDEIQFVTVPNESYEPDPNRVQWKDSADQIWSALREDRPVGATKKPATASPSPTTSPLTVSPDEVTVRVVNASGVPGLARQARAALEVQGFAGVTIGQRAGRPDRRARRVLRRPCRGGAHRGLRVPRCEGREGQRPRQHRAGDARFRCSRRRRAREPPRHRGPADAVDLVHADADRDGRDAQGRRRHLLLTTPRHPPGRGDTQPQGAPDRLGRRRAGPSSVASRRISGATRAEILCHPPRCP